MVTKRVYWNQPRKFQNIILHPSGMHIRRSFLGYICTLVKGSALEFYVTAAYWGINCISDGKSWIKARRTSTSVAAALLQRFLSTGQNTFDDFEQYIETDRIHPTAPHSFGNFLLPTLRIHQCKDTERKGEVQLKQLTIEQMMKHFFLAGHVQYVRYITQHLIELCAHAEYKVALG